MTFERSYLPGTRDANGRFMGGTETMRQVAHGGILFAGLSYWTDRPDRPTGDPWPGANLGHKRSRKRVGT